MTLLRVRPVASQVLQLVVAEHPTDKEFSEHYFTLLSGFIIVVCMMYSFNIMEPHAADRHVLRRSAAGGILYHALFSLKAVAVLQVGIGVKIHLYKPIAPSTSHFSAAARFHTALSIATCFGLIHFMKPLHKGFKLYYSAAAMREVPERVLVQLASLVSLAALIGLAALPLLPYQMMALSALSALLQVCARAVPLQRAREARAAAPAGATPPRADPRARPHLLPSAPPSSDTLAGRTSHPLSYFVLTRIAH